MRVEQGVNRGVSREVNRGASREVNRGASRGAKENDKYINTTLYIYL